MKAIVPVAGKGTRLRPLTHTTPKPLLRVAGQPILAYILDDLRALGVAEVIFVTGHLKERVEEYVRAAYPDVAARFIEQPVQNGTAGAVHLAAPYVQEDVLIVFADTIFEADLGEARRQPPEVAGVIWVQEVEDYQRFGVVVLDRTGAIERIVEKPREPISRLANIGLYYVRDWALLFEGIEAVLRGAPGPGGEFYLTDAFQYMIDRGARLVTARATGWYDAGKPEALLETNAHLLARGRARPPARGEGVIVHAPVYVDDGVVLEAAEIGPNVSLARGSVVRRARLRNAIVGERTEVVDSELEGALLGDDVRVRGLRGRAYLGDHCEVDVPA